MWPNLPAPGGPGVPEGRGGAAEARTLPFAARSLLSAVARSCFPNLKTGGLNAFHFWKEELSVVSGVSVVYHQANPTARQWP